MQVADSADYVPLKREHTKAYLARNNRNNAKRLQHGPPHGLGGLQPPAGCCASGENRKRSGESLLSHRPFFMFSMRPWGLFRSCLSELSVSKQFFVVHDSAVFSPSGRKLFFCQINPFAYWVQGQCPWRRGSGDEQSPAPFLRPSCRGITALSCSKKDGL